MSKYLVLILFFWQITSNIQAAQYHFASIDSLTEQKVGEIILTEVYRKLNIEISTSAFSGKRAEFEANEGLKDGEILRVWAYGDENPNLIRVPTPYLHLITMAFIRKDHNITLHDKTDLANYRLARVIEIKHTEYITQGMTNVVEASSTINMFKLLEQDSIDIALSDYVDGMWTLSKLDKNYHIIAYPKPLGRLGLYHYIHKKHRSLVKKVDDKIKEMTASGELAQIITAARHQVFGDTIKNYDFVDNGSIE